MPRIKKGRPEGRPFEIADTRNAYGAFVAFIGAVAAASLAALVAA